MAEDRTKWKAVIKIFTKELESNHGTFITVTTDSNDEEDKIMAKVDLGSVSQIETSERANEVINRFTLVWRRGRLAGMEDEVTFLFQLGVLRDAVAAPASRLTLAHLKELAVKFVHEKIPDNGLNRLSDRILLFRHDYCSSNVLQLINSASDVTDETLVEIVLTANPLLCDGEAPAPRPHALAVHSYKAPTFCDFCGEMLFGLVRQGLKCEGCNLNYHKRCAVKVPSNCAAAASRRASARSPSRASSASHASAPDDSLVRRLAQLVTGNHAARPQPATEGN
ncbi:jg22062 [Pararge aegeria aegeria]|uniref:Jg22062 protein n=1 Tax=Pararge aegeria aegeria TaxID=348720 RepID=A0A8S4RKS6_9NEOP|nr:jg22062 [Pararge aegeria aegeria]